MMRKLLSILFISLFLTACTTSEFVGKYVLSTIEINDTVYQEGDSEWETILGSNIPGEYIYIELENDGDMSYVITTNEKTGTWSENDSVITMIIDGYEEKATYEDEALVLVNTEGVKLIFVK